MDSDYKTYLAANILSDDRVITYRLASRAMRVHVNRAKEMLFEFHRQQNVRKPGSVHATYLVAGFKREEPPAVTAGEDSHMQSSPYKSSPVPHFEEETERSRNLSITLVQEEDLDKSCTEYETVTSIHIYSLGPQPLKDLQVLSDVAREVLEGFRKYDPLEDAKTYGTILNRRVRRRIGQRSQVSTSSMDGISTKTMITKSTTAAVKTHDKNTSSSSSQSKSEAKSAQSAATKDVPLKGPVERPVKKGVNNPPQLKRNSSSIFKAFAKAKPKLKQEDTDSSAYASGIDSVAPSGPEDEPMKHASEDEEDDYVPPVASKGLLDDKTISRGEREAALKKMMDDADSADEALNAPELGEIEEPRKLEEDSTLPVDGKSTISEGRRRGRRRVMKKKTIQDDEGYLVTREEPAWESFSEDDLVVQKPKPPSSVVALGTGKAKKVTGKGQGNIMSFFGKK